MVLGVGCIAEQRGAWLPLWAAVWMKPELQDAAPDTAGQWRVTTAPGGAGNVGGSSIGITKNCKNVETAYKVLTWMTNTENQVKSLEQLGLFPVPDFRPG